MESLKSHILNKIYKLKFKESKSDEECEQLDLMEQIIEEFERLELTIALLSGKLDLAVDTLYQYGAYWAWDFSDNGTRNVMICDLDKDNVAGASARDTVKSLIGTADHLIEKENQNV